MGRACAIFLRSRESPVANGQTTVLKLAKVSMAPLQLIPEDTREYFDRGVNILTLRPNTEVLDIIECWTDSQIQLGLHWLIKKKYNSRHKIPVKRDMAKAFEPWGDFLLATYELCLQCHPFETSRQYLSGADWFSRVLVETRLNLLNSSSDQAYRGTTKRSQIDDVRQAIKAMRNGENPIDAERCPHEHTLISVAIKMVGENDLFRKTYWEGGRGKNFNPKTFLGALSAWQSSIDRCKNLQSLIAKDNVLYVRTGQGSGMIRLTI
jgi:hypothetical protein